jgi:plastocyanin
LRTLLVCAIGAGVGAGAAPESRAPVAEAGGAIAGQVSVVTRSTRRLASAGAYPGRTVVIPSKAQSPETTNVVVFLQRPPAGPPPPARHAVIRQQGETFVPHLVAVTTGSTVTFPNDDQLFHNVFSLSPGAVFDLGRYPRGQSASYTFTTPGVVKVFCHLHSHMSAIVRVFDHSYFAVPGADGRYRLDGVPPGRHAVTAWHERAGDLTQDVTVTADGTAALSFALPLGEGR